MSQAQSIFGLFWVPEKVHGFCKPFESCESLGLALASLIPSLMGVGCFLAKAPKLGDSTLANAQSERIQILVFR